MVNLCAHPSLSAVETIVCGPGGEPAHRLEQLTRQWILPAPGSNPGMLEMFRRRDRQPYLHMMPWAGEFAGKYLTHSVQIWRLTRDPELERHLRWFVSELVSLQAEDGYLGPWPTAWQMRVGNPHAPDPSWDAWGHYHTMLGLLLWHQQTNDEQALTCVRRIGDYMCERFLGTGDSLHATDEQDKNLAPIHSLALLHQVTGEPRYLELALRIEKELELPPAGDYIRLALRGVEFHDMPKPRWESLHSILALPELFYITGSAYYSEAFQNLWWSMVRGDRHNNGGFTSGEQAVGDPYASGAIETCCTVAWMAMSVEMLRLTGNPIVADELELSMWNSGLGLISPSGRWVTYDTPSDGRRLASAHSIAFQAQAGTPELNCCSVNGPRVLGMLCEWAVMRSEKGLAVNYYGSGQTLASLASGARVGLDQTTDYPFESRVAIVVQIDSPVSFELALRIPSWSEKTSISLNGLALENVAAGNYCRIEREWHDGDSVIIDLDFRPHFWAWRETADGTWLASIYRGPILLALDPRFNAATESGLPTLDAANLGLRRVTPCQWLPPLMLLATNCGNGEHIHLCDFASAGAAGDPYHSWLPVKFASPPTSTFSFANPLRSFRQDSPV